MLCPKCHSYSVRLDKGANVCGISTCTYINPHPITYQNDVMHYDGEDKRQNRFSNLYSNVLDNGGIDVEREGNFDKNYKKGRKKIRDACHILKINQNIQEIACAKLFQILRLQHLQLLQRKSSYIKKQKQIQKQIKEKEKETQKQKQSKGGENVVKEVQIEQVEESEKEQVPQNFDDENGEILQKKKKKHNQSHKNQAAYCIYSACFQKQNYLQQFYICKHFQIPYKQWRCVVQSFNARFKTKLPNIPQMKARHLIERVCLKRQIAPQQRKAMIQLAQKLTQSGNMDVRINTIAGLSFWIIIEHSKTYRGLIKPHQFCRRYDDLFKQNAKISQIQKYFDITYENVKKVLKERVLDKLYTHYLPQWNGRIDDQLMLKDIA